jgi:hypothetical protein
MKPKITRELQQTLDADPRIEIVHFETATGLHHFNHVRREKVKEVGKDGKTVEKETGRLTVNGKEVEPVKRKDIMAATPDSKASEEMAGYNAILIADALKGMLQEMMKNGTLSPAGMALASAAEKDGK